MFEYLKYIRILNAPEDSDECFQGLGASGAGAVEIAAGENGVNVTVSAEVPEAGTEPVSSELWSKQEDVINSQSVQMKELAELYSAQKEGTLKKLWNYGVDKFSEFVIGEVLEKFLPLDWAGEFGDDLADILAEQMYSALTRLLKGYSTSTELFEHVQAENNAMLDLVANEKNYALRNNTIERNTALVRSMLAVILESESIFQLSLGLNLSGSTRSEVSEELIQALKDLRWNNILVQGKDGKKLLLANNVVAEDS